LRAIARALGRGHTTIADEVQRNAVGGVYDPQKAAHKTYVRRKYAKYQGMKIVGHDELRGFVERGLKEGRSPESIAKRVNRRERHLPTISGDSIERFLRSVYGREIESIRNALKQKRRWRRKRPKSARLGDRKFIDVRPRIANRRGRVGDAEGDFIESGRAGSGRLLVVVDRKLRVTFIEKVWPVSVANITRAFLRIKTRYPEMRTLTTDNDILLGHHEELEQLLGIKIFFCHPYHSWEKGTVENTNGEIRKYIPKGADISKRSRYFIRSVEAKLNDRYMDCLDSRTPAEAMTDYRKRKNPH
jgi:transposase, IS30 family